jgi:AcrR family transcriptional regulator
MPGRKASEETRREDILRAAYDVAARHGVEALTVRAVAARAEVSHGTVLFHFKRKSELVAALLDRVVYATAVLRVPDDVDRVTRPSERLEALMHAEMDRLTADPRHFRLFLEYWTLGVRNLTIRRKVSTALEGYRAALRSAAEAVVNGEAGDRTTADGEEPPPIADGVAAVAVSLIHGCALQAVIDPKRFDVQQHFDVAARMLEGLTARAPVVPTG